MGQLDEAANQTCEINMTPMIDCVFQLLLFFMLTANMSSLDMEMLSLPFADQAKEPDPGAVPPDRQVVVNIMKDDAKKGVVRVQGTEYDKNKLTELLRQEAILSGEEKPDPNLPKTKIYRLIVFIRCDRDARYETVQWVFDACSRNFVYKTIIAASPNTE